MLKVYFLFSPNILSYMDDPSYTPKISTKMDILPLLGFFTEHYLLMSWLIFILTLLLIIVGTMFIALKRDISFFEVWFNGYTPHFLKKKSKNHKK